MRRTRHKNDFYSTPALLTRELLNRVGITGNVLECCSGDGAIAAELQSPTRKIYTNEINSSYNPLFNYDATIPYTWLSIKEQIKTVDWVVTNPSFATANKIIPLAWDACTTAIAMLLRTTYVTEPCSNRAEWLKSNSLHMKHFITFNPRPKFRVDTTSTDTCTVAWFVWEKDWDLGLTNGIEYVTDWRDKT